MTLKIAFDTNILLDTILNRPGRAEAIQLMYAVSEEKIFGIVSANTITDVYYTSKKGIGDAAARNAILDILSIYDVVPVDGETCSVALNEPMADYEDAVLAVCAAREEADYIVTRDRAFLSTPTPVPAMTPTDLLRVIEEQDEP